MTDPLEEALAASTRTIQHLDQQLAATREANARLTAKVVQLEIQLRAAYTELRERDDAYEAASEALLNARDQLVSNLQAIAELRADLAARNVRIDELEGLLTTYGP